MKIIESFNGHAAIRVSDIDADLAEFAWFSNSNGYAVRAGNHSPRLVRMHRVIAGRMLGRKLERHELVDHINRNRLDNRRSNLRIVGYAENNRNVEARGSSGYKGVYPNPGSKQRPWLAKATIDYKQVYLGSFSTKKEAAKAYDAFAATLPCKHTGDK